VRYVLDSCIKLFPGKIPFSFFVLTNLFPSNCGARSGSEIPDSANNLYLIIYNNTVLKEFREFRDMLNFEKDIADVLVLTIFLTFGLTVFTLHAVKGTGARN